MKYVGKKFVTLIITLLLISFLVFLTFDIIPGDAAMAQLGTEATPERLEALREEMGLNQPFLQRYGQWLIAFLHGDFGMSYKYKVSVQSIQITDYSDDGTDFFCTDDRSITANWNLYSQA